MSNLPITAQPKYSDKNVKRFFEGYYKERVSYPSNQLDAVINFFTNRGFDETAAVSTGTVLLEQAKRDEVNVFRLLDTLKGLSDVELSNIVTEILNNARPKTSSLGYRRPAANDLFERRNIAP